MKNKLSRRQFGKLAASAVAGAGLNSCVPKAGVEYARLSGFVPGIFLNEMEDEEVSRVLEIDGDPNLGIIYSIHQMHRLPGIPPESTPSFIIDCVFNYQLRILRELIRIRCNAVFLEGCVTTECHDSAELEFLKRHKVFFDGEDMARVERANRGKEFMMFKRIVYKHGAAPYYYLFNPDMRLHGTSTKQEAQLVNDYIKSRGDKVLIPDQKASQLHDRREKWAIREIMAYFKKNRGAVAALIYGANHGFCQELAEYSPRPRLYTIDFPGYMKKAKLICGTAQTSPRQCSESL